MKCWVDNLNHELVQELGFQITNVPVYSPAAIADLSVTQALNLYVEQKNLFQS